MPEENLPISRWDAVIPVVISATELQHLQNYHLMGIRFLYECFDRERSGAILNHESGMNVQIQVAVFLNALKPLMSTNYSVLIISSEENVQVWHYHLAKHGGFNVILSETNYQRVLQGKTYGAIVCTVANLGLLNELDKSSLIVAVDELDVVITKNVVKRLHGRFNIGLTTRNFLRYPDQKLFWSMVNWSNPGALGKFAEFCKEDEEHLKNLRDPYRDWWQRLTWNFCDSFKQPSLDEKKLYDTSIKEWVKKHKLIYTNTSTCKLKIQTRKRKPVKEEFNLETTQDIESEVIEKPVTRTSKRKTKKGAKTQKIKRKLSSQQLQELKNLLSDTSDSEETMKSTVESQSDSNKSTKSTLKCGKNKGFELMNNNYKLEPMDSSQENITNGYVDNLEIGVAPEPNCNKNEILSMLFGDSQDVTMKVEPASQKNDILSLLYG